MKTAEEKAEYWLNDNVAGWDLKHLECLTILLKEQHRDTRHACSEEVAKIELDENFMIDWTLAHTAIMNTKAV